VALAPYIRTLAVRGVPDRDGHAASRSLVAGGLTPAAVAMQAGTYILSLLSST